MRGRRRTLVGLVVLSIVSASCRTQTPSTTPAQPVRGGTLVIGIGMIDLANPATTTQPSKIFSSMLIYQSLLSVDSDLVPRPELAESFEAEDDGATWRFTLRKTQWHDGKPFTSEDVKFSFEKLLLEFHPRTRQVLLPKLQAIETPDAQTVIFRLKSPFSAFPLLLNIGDTPILPKHIFDGTDPKTNPANEKPIGTGPFKFVSYKKDEELRLTQNPDYFREGVPYLKEVVFRAIPDDAQALQALERGDLDILVGIQSPAELRRLVDSPDLQVVENTVDPVGANCGRFLGFNLDRPMFADVRLRRAIAHGIDRERIVDQLLFGFGQPHNSPLHSGFEWARANVDYPDFDKEMAEELLTTAGWKKGADGKRAASGVDGVADGTPLRFEVIVSTLYTKYGETIRDQMADLGIEVDVTPAALDLITSRVYQKRMFDTYLALQCQGADPELGLRRTIHSSAVSPVAFTNGSGYKNSEIDSLLDRSAAELDQDERGELYGQIQVILARDLPYIWLVEDHNLHAHSKSCLGLRFDSVHLVERAYCRN